ncbi:MAG: hypothetical protein LLG37_00115, partial [Spirochaetia bacterium]|nr:hypothetical protein [Spirochaetia bacterium]
MRILGKSGQIIVFLFMSVVVFGYHEPEVEVYVPARPDWQQSFYGSEKYKAEIFFEKSIDELKDIMPVDVIHNENDEYVL